MNDDVVKILDGNTFVVSDDRGDIEASPTDPTGLFSFDTRFLSKWVLTRQRRAAERALGRRSPVLRDPLLPRAGHRDRLHRREAVGDPAARGRRRLPRGADDPQPRREAGRADACGSMPPATSPTCSRSRTRSKKKGTYSNRVERRPAGARLRARDVPARDDDLGDRAPAQVRRERPHLHGQDPAARRMVDRAARRSPGIGAARSGRGDGPAARRPTMEREPRAVARRARPGSSATGSR